MWRLPPADNDVEMISVTGSPRAFHGPHPYSQMPSSPFPMPPHNLPPLHLQSPHHGMSNPFTPQEDIPISMKMDSLRRARSQRVGPVSFEAPPGTRSVPHFSPTTQRIDRFNESHLPTLNGNPFMPPNSRPPPEYYQPPYIPLTPQRHMMREEAMPSNIPFQQDNYQREHQHQPFPQQQAPFPQNQQNPSETTAAPPSIQITPQTVLDPSQFQQQLEELRLIQNPKRITAYLFFAKFALFIIFLIIMLLSLIQDRQVSHCYNIYRNIKRSIETETFDQIDGISEAVDYIQNDLAVNFLRGYLTWDRKVMTDYPAIYGSYVPLTTLRLRQQRVRKGCSREDWRDKFGVCYPAAETSNFDTSPILGKFPSGSGAYSSESKLCSNLLLCSQDLYGEFGYVYPSGGFVYDADLKWAVTQIKGFAANSTDGRVTNDNLKQITKQMFSWILENQASWLDEQSRALVVEFSLMMPNFPSAPFFISPTILFEFPAEGGILINTDYTPLVIYTDPTKLEIILLVYSCGVMLTYLVQKGRLLVMKTPCILCFINANYDNTINTNWYTCRKCSNKYDRWENDYCQRCETPYQHWIHVCFLHGALRDINMWQQLLNMSLIVSTYIMRVETRSALSQRLNIYKDATDVSSVNYIDFGPIKNRMTVTYALGAVNCFLTMIGLFTFLSQLETYNRFLRLFYYGIKRLIMFIFTFAIMFVGFALAFQLSSGVSTKDFNKTNRSFVTTFRLIIGDFSYLNFKGESDSLKGFLYVFFNVMIVIVSMNVFISIVQKAYEDAARRPDNVVASSLRLLLEDAKSSFLKRTSEKLPGFSGSNQTVKRTTTIEDAVLLAKSIVQEQSQKGLPYMYSYH